ncbi:hypothetical protein FRB93_001145 [Tulasnella sp. JGI-2019a]|nr:hypothetical protein FRB93_001145 [Tulasnella sp. JGI-2019a]
MIFAPLFSPVDNPVIRHPPSSRAPSRQSFEPFPGTLIAVKVRQLADWAVLDDVNRDQLEVAIHGDEDILALALKNFPLTLKDLCRIRAVMSSIVMPLLKGLMGFDLILMEYGLSQTVIRTTIKDIVDGMARPVPPV